MSRQIASVAAPASAGAVGAAFRADAQELPPAFIEWQLSARRAAYARVAAGERPTRFSAHLPVAVTLNQHSGFAIHTATKGTGFLPRDEYLDEHISLLEQCLAGCRGRPWQETLDERVALIRRFYEHPEHIDLRRLGLLEIFQGQTYHNLLADPRLTLHYTGEGPDYPSFQVNTLAEIVGPEDRRFQFICLARQLFERDRFHVRQPDYPLGYVAWVQEVYDKSPFHGRAGRRLPAAPRVPPVDIKEILVPLDNSRHSEHCMSIGLQLAGGFGAGLTGLHIYAARLHDRRFREMEAGLPPKYQQPTELTRQRRAHDSLITRGLELISDSLLDVLAARCREADIEFTHKHAEGKNYAALLADMEKGEYDLVIIGARGLGAVDPGGADLPLLGSVTERVARRADANLLVVKNDVPLGGTIVVAVDGSPQSFAALRLALALARATGATVQAVAAYDPHFHKVAFRGLEGVLSEEAGRVFRFQEQQKLHDEIIDKGIAKIYRDHLETARRIAADDGATIETALLEGKPFAAVLAHVDRVQPTLLVVGRLGVHADAGLDLGATAENLLRLAGCHVLLVADRFDPTTGRQVLEALSEGVPWTAEALARLENVPPFARSFARRAIDDYVRERGYAQVTPSVMAEAREKLGV